MIFGPNPSESAAGTILAHGLRVGAAWWPKGRLLSPADIDALHAAAIETVIVARLEAGDVAEDAAAAQLAARLAGDGCMVEPPVHGRCNIRAGADGLCLLDIDVLDAVNRLDPALTIATRAACAAVRAGEIVATVKVIPYAVPQTLVTAACAACHAPSVSVAAYRGQPAALVQTYLDDPNEKLFGKTERVLRQRLARLGSTMTILPTVPHTVDALAKALSEAPAGSLLLVQGASATIDPRDIIPEAIRRAGGHVERVGMPVDPGNLLCLGWLDGRAVIGLPGCARSPKRNGVDLVLERLLAGQPVGSGDIARMGVGGLLDDTAERGIPRARPPRLTIGAIVLAAGLSRRMGANKLLLDLGGAPVVRRTVEAVLAAELPVLAMLGHESETVTAALEGLPIMQAHAASFADGMGATLAEAARAIPADWDGALVMLGDMPSIDPETIRGLIAAFDPERGRDIVYPLYEETRGHPVLWGRAHFAALAALSGDTGARGLLAANRLRTLAVPVDDPGVLADVDTPQAYAALQAMWPLRR